MTGFAGQAVRNGWSREVLSTGRDSTAVRACPTVPFPVVADQRLLPNVQLNWGATATFAK